MSEFVGRTGSLRVYSYPETKGAGASQQFARNFAYGPDAFLIDVPIDPGILLPWSTIVSGAPPGTSVPITPQVTGIVRVHAVVTVKNAADAPITVFASVELDGTPLLVPAVEGVTLINGGGTAELPILTQPIDLLPLGVAANFAIRLTASAEPGVILSILSSTIELQEVLAETG